MTHDAYSTKRVTVWDEARDGQPGKAVKYQDGNMSWCPEEVYQRDYQSIDALSFGHALHALERGDRVARAGWNGKGMWLVMATSDWSAQLKSALALPSDWQGYLPFIAMYTADRRLVPWLPSQTDMLAKDWTILP